MTSTFARTGLLGVALCSAIGGCSAAQQAAQGLDGGLQTIQSATDAAMSAKATLESFKNIGGGGANRLNQAAIEAVYRRARQPLLDDLAAR